MAPNSCASSTLSARNRFPWSRWPAALQDPKEASIASLSGQERELIRLVGQGWNARQIVERLFISEITVHHHLTSIYAKLAVTGRLELLIFAYRNRLAGIPR